MSSILGSRVLPVPATVAGSTAVTQTPGPGNTVDLNATQSTLRQGARLQIAFTDGGAAGNVTFTLSPSCDSAGANFDSDDLGLQFVVPADGNSGQRIKSFPFPIDGIRKLAVTKIDNISANAITGISVTLCHPIK